jgi:phosphoribosylamine--glycine ligase
MKMLVIGGGGREHALVTALAQSASCTELVCAPGNSGVELLARCVPTDMSTADLIAIARAEAPDLVVIGPEQPLVDGLADMLRAAGVAVFGPGRDGAALEASKWFAKQVLAAAGVPTAEALAFDDADSALAHVRQQGAPIVIKADGLAAGKGVVVATTVAAAELAIRDAMVEACFGDAGARVVVEECLVGPELSILALVSGSTVRLLPPARDHKRAYDGDTGPNTGGMGAISPPPDVDDALLEQIERDVLQPVVDELVRRGIDYRGVLYAGLMLTADGPQVIEFNVRFGDPEAQVVLPRLCGDVARQLHATAIGELATVPDLAWDQRAAVGIVVAAAGYPDAPRTGDPIEIATDTEAPCAEALGHTFHAGVTRDRDGRLRTSGGRVATAVGIAGSFDEARETAGRRARAISFDGAWYRTDIGRSSLALSSPP